MQKKSSFSLVILAAGLGSRFGGNKPLAGFGPNNVTLLELNMFNAYQAGCRHVVLIIAPKAQSLFKTQFSNKLPSDLFIEFSEQHTTDLPHNKTLPNRIKPLGTAHALWSCRQLIDSPFVVTNGDDYYGASAFKTARLHIEQHPKQWALVGYNIDKTLSDFGGVNRGLCYQNGDGSLASVTECYNIQTQADKIIGELAKQPITLAPTQLVSMNFWCFTPAIFDALTLHIDRFITHASNDQECQLPDIITQVLPTMSIHVYRTQSRWFGLTYLNDKQWVAEQLNQLLADEKAFYLQN